MDTDPLSVFYFLDAGIAVHTVSWSKILLTLFLVFLNGFFVAAEFAIVKVRASQLEIRNDLNKGLIGTAKNIVNNLDSYLAATQLGITLASLGLGWVGEEVMTGIILKTVDFFGFGIDPQFAQKISVPIAFSIITVLHIVFGELAPKSIAIRYPTKTTLGVAWPLRFFYFICRPIIWLMNGFANFLLRIIGIKPIHGSEIHTEEELKVIISESHEGGAIEETERTLIQNVFEFDDRRVSNIQTLRKNISAIEQDTPIKEAIEYAVKEGYSRYPVYENNLENIKGLVYTKDLIKYLLDEKAQHGNIIPVLRTATYITESTKIKHILKEFQRKHQQMAIVTNEIGELTGIVTMEDILEELVGEIQDEYDNEKPIVENMGDDTFIISAHHPLSDINKYIPFKLEEGEHFETLAGLLSETYNEQGLKVGDILDLNDYTAKIVKMYRNSAETVELRIKKEED